MSFIFVFIKNWFPVILLGISTHEEECIESSDFMYNASADVCYYIGPEVDMDFTYINTLCPLLGSKLMAIYSQVKQIFVQEILGKQLYYIFYLDLLSCIHNKYYKDLVYNYHFYHSFCRGSIIDVSKWKWNNKLILYVLRYSNIQFYKMFGF